jgi:acyl-CoA thioester hydrolase
MPALPAVARYRVLFADCDPMRIMYYGNYFRVFEIGRAELFRGLGHPFTDYIARGLYLAVIETACRYRRPAYYDDELDVHAGVGEVSGAKLRIDYAVQRDGMLLAEGHTLHAVLDERGRPQRIPAAIRAVRPEA